MNTDTLLKRLADIVGKVAPEADLSDIEADEDFREQLDIDSMDFLNIMVGVKKELGVDVPESDYGDIETLDDLLNYLGPKVG